MIHAIPAFQDNYIWIITSEKESAAIVVDPGDADVVIEHLQQQALTLVAVLITHHHHDHIGGLEKLVHYAETHQGNLIPVFGPAQESIPGVTHLLREGDRVTIQDIALGFDVIDVPGHTRGHIAYFSDAVDVSGRRQSALFCGDTLFAAGCGRLFEGTAEQMFSSLQKLRNLPPETAVYCAHEYTLANLRFAQVAFPDNQEIQQRAAEVEALRENGQITLPSAIAIERRTNPFLLCRNAQEFKVLRQRKDEFRG